MDLESEESCLWPSPRFALLDFFSSSARQASSPLPCLTLITVTTENSDGNLVKGSANYNGLYKFGRLTVIFIRTQIFSIVCCPVWCFLIWSLQLHCKFELREHILDSACPQCLQYWAHDPHIKILVGWLLVGLILFFFFNGFDSHCKVFCDFSGFLIDKKKKFFSGTSHNVYLAYDLYSLSFSQPAGQNSIRKKTIQAKAKNIYTFSRPVSKVPFKDQKRGQKVYQ